MYVSDALGKTTFRNCFPGIGGHKNFMSLFSAPCAVAKTHMAKTRTSSFQVLLTGHKHVQINITPASHPAIQPSNHPTQRPEVSRTPQNCDLLLFGWQLVMCLFVYFQVFALAIFRKLQTGTEIPRGLGLGQGLGILAATWLGLSAVP